jgi:hypothetical protein
MQGLDGSWAQSGLLLAALWAAVATYRGTQPVRFVLGLVAGCVSARIGWALLHLPMVAAQPGSILHESAGYTILFFPLGPLLIAPGDASWRALPLPLAVARLGCLAAGCCGGVAAPWGVHPTPVYEAIGLVGLHFCSRAPGPTGGLSTFLIGFGLERILVEPFRAAPPLGEPIVAPALVSVCWVLAGFLLRNCSRPEGQAGVRFRSNIGWGRRKLAASGRVTRAATWQPRRRGRAVARALEEEHPQ